MSGSGLGLLILLGGLIWFWHDSLRVRERAMQAAREVCQRQQLQLLDASVNLQRVVWCRRPARSPCLRRTFQFAYSEDGLERHSGFVIIAGNHVEQVGL